MSRASSQKTAQKTDLPPTVPPDSSDDDESPDTPTQLAPTPFARALKRTPAGETFLWYLYVPLLLLALLLAALAAAPAYLFCRRARPRLPRGAPRDPKCPESRYEWYGPEKDYPPGTALVPLGKGPGGQRRVWEMFGYFREIWHMTTRQGLQVGGVLSGLTIILYQTEMMWHDYSADSVIGYQEATGGGFSDPNEQLRGDPKCAYATGTGIANWGAGMEPLAWYGCYHGFLILLCLCVIGDEVMNVRFGCFAPQYFRGGIGYTIMFLASATLSTSPNWGVTRIIQFRYVVLTLIFLFGTFNVLRTFVCSLGMASAGYRHTDYRVGRKPLRPWTESEWLDPYYRQNFIQHAFDRYFATERWQCKVGDWDFPLERRPKEDIERQLEEMDERDEGVAEVRIQKVYQRERGELRRMRGRIGRTIVHGGPKKMPMKMVNDLEQRKRMHVGNIDPRHPPTAEQEEEIIRMFEKDKGYFGIANWKPRTKSFAWWWFDLRRAAAVVCGLGLMVVRLGLCNYDLAYSNLASYRTQYDEMKEAWRDTHTGGPDPAKCQYYEGSSVPIFVATGQGSYWGVTSSMIWVGIWSTFLLGMCIAVVLVAVSNNLWWGMHWPFPPITLVGPRMTSMSIGNTLGFVALATLQQGFYFGNASLVTVTRIICYASLGVCVLGVYPNEPLRVNYTRDPFWPWLSRVAFRFKDRKKWHYDWNADDMEG